MSFFKKPNKHDNQSQYFDNATSWETSRVADALLSRKRAYLVAFMLGCVVIIQALALVMLTPLKTVKLEAIVMDRATGSVNPITSVNVIQENLDDIFIKKFVTDFLLARENYTFDTAEINYYTAAAFMSPQLQTQWGSFWATDNPESPLAVYKELVTARIDINTIQIHEKASGKKDTATIRFSKTVKDADLTRTDNYIATLNFKFVDVPTDERTRRINPIGFMVTNYLVDDEVSGLKKEGRK